MENTWTEIMGSSQRQKATIPTKIEMKKRRVIFRYKALLSQKSEANLILALNKILQKAGISTYSQSKAISI